MSKKKMNKKLLIIILSILIVSVIIVVGLFAFDMSQNEETSSVSTITKSSLQKVLEISELSTVEYTYNAIATMYDENKKDVLYYVAYKGTVPVGIDLKKVDISDIVEPEVSNDQSSTETTAPVKKQIIITIPKVQMFEPSVDTGTLEFIFIDKKSETEHVLADAYELCRSDLKNRIKSEDALFKTAQENANSAIEALFKPCISTIDSEYEVIFRQAGAEK